MNASKAYIEYATARAEAWAMHDALVVDGKVLCSEDLDANEGYQAAVEREYIAWEHYLRLCKESLQEKLPALARAAMPGSRTDGIPPGAELGYKQNDIRRYSDVCTNPSSQNF